MIAPRRSPRPHVFLADGISDPRIAGVIELARGATRPAARHALSHADKVALYARAAGAAMGLPSETRSRLALCGLVHDVGKAALPEDLLSKPAPLDEDEFADMARHPELGAGMLPGPDFADVRLWTLYHHERPDGLGYPHGLTRDEIPLEARIIAVADAYSAMIEDRPYRRALREWQACRELVNGAGTHFDSVVVSVFLRILRADAGPVRARGF